MILPASFPHQGNQEYQHPTWRDRVRSNVDRFPLVRVVFHQIPTDFGTYLPLAVHA